MFTISCLWLTRPMRIFRISITLVAIGQSVATCEVHLLLRVTYGVLEGVGRRRRHHHVED